MKKLIYFITFLFLVSCSNDSDSCELTTFEITIPAEGGMLFSGNISNCEDIMISQGFIVSKNQSLVTIEQDDAGNNITIFPVNGEQIEYYTGNNFTIIDIDGGATYYCRTFVTHNGGTYYGNEVSIVYN